MISRAFLSKFQQIYIYFCFWEKSFTHKSCQIVAGICTVCQFHDFFSSNFQWNFEVWPNCPSPGTLKTGSYRQLFYHSFWLARLPNSCRVKLTREPMSKVETNRAMDWCLKNCVTRGEPIKTLFSSSNVLLACYKGFPWWKRRVELQPQIPPQRLQKWEEFAQCLCYFLIEFCSWNQL